MLEELKGMLHDQSIEFKRVIGRGARKAGGARCERHITHGAFRFHPDQGAAIEGS